jgi:phosphoribosylformylglycinamidine synthase
LAKLGKELKAFAEEGRPVLGICNGFQVLVEAGLLPGFDGISLYPEATLATNLPPGYNCRWINLKHENTGKCVFTQRIPKGKVLRVPIAHAEGRFLFPKDKEKSYLKKLCENDQLVFRYCDEQGEYANGEFPANPNGSYHDLFILPDKVGLGDPEGKIFGLMPHPERAFYCWQQADWTKREGKSEFADGKLIFENLIAYLQKKD